MKMPSNLQGGMNARLRDGIHKREFHQLYLGVMQYYAYDNNYERLRLYCKRNIKQDMTKDEWEELMMDLQHFESQPHIVAGVFK
jgi:hypothetical protein